MQQLGALDATSLRLSREVIMNARFGQGVDKGLRMGSETLLVD
jgi:hypothetical protein